MDEQEYKPACETVRLRHPYTGDTREVEATPQEMVPLMGLGYQQVKEENE